MWQHDCRPGPDNPNRTGSQATQPSARSARRALDHSLGHPSLPKAGVVALRHSWTTRRVVVCLTDSLIAVHEAASRWRKVHLSAC